MSSDVYQAVTDRLVAQQKKGVGECACRGTARASELPAFLIEDESDAVALDEGSAFTRAFSEVSAGAGGRGICTLTCPYRRRRRSAMPASVRDGRRCHI
jgi:hypothetical protein